jgi:hypothetical protein
VPGLGLAFAVAVATVGRGGVMVDAGVDEDIELLSPPSELSDFRCLRKVKHPRHLRRWS